MGRHTIEIDLNESAKGEKVEKDPFGIADDVELDEVKWSDLPTRTKVGRTVKTTTKLLVLLALLYLFICSLSFLSSAFRLLGGKAAGEAFSSNKVLKNPVAGLMIGVLATVLVQSSSTSTSIVVAMVASKILTVQTAIPIIMGANIGTSVTNTFVSLAQVSDRDQFRRAFAGATVHDMFNILSVLVFLPIEVACGYLYHLTNILIKKMNLHQSTSSTKKEFLSKLTKPFTNLIIQLDKGVITKIAQGDKDAASKSLIKYWCDKGKKQVIKIQAQNATNATLNNTFINKTITVHSKPCAFLLHDTGLSDGVIGLIMLLASLIILCFCLVGIVKLLHSMLQGRIATVIKKTVNNDLPKPFGFLTGYLAIVIGAIMTILVQSSSIFTSTLTPLVGLGLVSLGRIFPLTLGSNVGTTGTSLLAAMASSGDSLQYSIQIALCHLFFNISGILVWYPIPAMRKVPLSMAKFLGNTTAAYRWFAPVYIAFFFFVIPGTVFALSVAGPEWLLGIGGSTAILLIFISVVNILQSKTPRYLPKVLRNWEWAPMWMRSLEPYDKFLVKIASFTKRLRTGKSNKSEIMIHLQTGNYGNIDKNLPEFSIVSTV
ncbi:sodium-dependent phosphate transport protein 2B-like [Rhopilema esculentum]|uniref:sodium-dependent phosphate transport protein 2B-like n=1 Tax=Rhopilema esculentum TaxID=499914 RepID=UPI0031DF3815|eukprot:gene14265-5292_t